MKQIEMKFEKRKQEPVTIQRLQSVVDLIAQGVVLRQALHKVGLSGNMGKYLVDARVLGRYDGKTVFVIKQKIERKDYYRVMDMQKKCRHKKYLKTKEKMKHLSYLEQKKDSRFIDVPDTDMLGLVNLPKTEPIKLQRTSKPRAKKAVALPWWKRFLLYLLNH